VYIDYSPIRHHPVDHTMSTTQMLAGDLLQSLRCSVAADGFISLNEPSSLLQDYVQDATS
jgi:hypothetical protein